MPWMRHPRAALDAYLDGELDLSRAPRIATHLVECSGCREKARATARMQSSLRTMAECSTS